MKKCVKWLVLIAFSAVGFLGGAVAGSEGVQPGETVFRVNPTDPVVARQVQELGGAISPDGPDGHPAIQLSNPAKKPRILLEFSLDAARLRGTKLSMSGMIRGEALNPLNPADSLRSYEGAKFQVFVNSPTQGQQYFDSRNLHALFPGAPMDGSLPSPMARPE